MGHRSLLVLGTCQGIKRVGVPFGVPASFDSTFAMSYGNIYFLTLLELAFFCGWKWKGARKINKIGSQMMMSTMEDVFRKRKGNTQKGRDVLCLIIGGH